LDNKTAGFVSTLPAIDSLQKSVKSGTRHGTGRSRQCTDVVPMFGKLGHKVPWKEACSMNNKNPIAIILRM